MKNHKQWEFTRASGVFYIIVSNVCTTQHLQKARQQLHTDQLCQQATFTQKPPTALDDQGGVMLS